MMLLTTFSMFKHYFSPTRQTARRWRKESDDLLVWAAPPKCKYIQYKVYKVFKKG